MKNRRALLRILTLLTLLLTIGIPTGFFVRAVHQEQLDQVLIKAIKVGYTDKVFAVLGAGANPNAKDFDNHQTALLLAYMTDIARYAPGDHFTFMTALLDAGANANAPDGTKAQITLLMRAAHFNHPEVISLFLRYGADLNIRDQRGYTALDFIPKQDANAIEQMLRKAGAKTGKELDAEKQQGYKR